ncbi:MAG: cupin-like domain-containing protein, partial [Microcoleus sp.]
MPDTQPLTITLPPLRITLTEQQQVNLEWLTQNLPNLLAAAPSKPEIPDNLKQWVAANKLLNQPDADIIQGLVNTGIDAETAVAEVTKISSHPYFQAGSQYVQLLQKLESQLSINNQLAALSSKFGTIERKSSLSREYFLENYYAKNTPVIITNIMHNWKALQLWTPEYLQEKYGDAEVEIQVNRNSDPDYEIKVHNHKKTVLFREYIDMVVNGGPSNDCYMVANNQTLEREEFKPLFNDFEIFPEYLTPGDTKGRVFFWFGPKGT